MGGAPAPQGSSYILEGEALTPEAAGWAAPGGTAGLCVPGFPGPRLGRRQPAAHTGKCSVPGAILSNAARASGGQRRVGALGPAGLDSVLTWPLTSTGTQDSGLDLSMPCFLSCEMGVGTEAT